MVLGACSSNIVTVHPAQLWPFEQFSVRVNDGPEAVAFYSRPDVEPRRLVVVVQSPPCEASRAQPQFAQAISTSGVLWKQLARDSAYIQFDRVGPKQDGAPSVCAATPWTIESWRSETASTIAAIRKAEGLLSHATLYFGLGEGAYVASLLAAKDRTAEGLVLINGSGLNDDFRRLAPRLPLLIVHGSNDDRTAVEAAVLLFSRLASTRRGVSLVMLDEYSHDLNLGGGRPECFEAAMQLIVSRARTMTAGADSKQGRVEWTDCADAMKEFPPD